MGNVCTNNIISMLSASKDKQIICIIFFLRLLYFFGNGTRKWGTNLQMQICLNVHNICLLFTISNQEFQFGCINIILPADNRYPRIDSWMNRKIQQNLHFKVCDLSGWRYNEVPGEEEKCELQQQWWIIKSRKYSQFWSLHEFYSSMTYHFTVWSLEVGKNSI